MPEMPINTTFSGVDRPCSASAETLLPFFPTAKNIIYPEYPIIFLGTHFKCVFSALDPSAQEQKPIFSVLPFWE